MNLPAGVLFALLCVFWGGNWLAVKIAVAEVPPLTFTAARSLVAGACMLALAPRGDVLALLRRAPLRMTAVAILTNTLTYAGLYWGTSRVPSGLAAIVNNALMPVGLFAFALAFREDTYSPRRLAGIALGAVGLGLLFARRSTSGVGDAAALGVAAVVGGTLAYCLGSVWSRPLLRGAAPMTVGALQMTLGGVLLVPWALASERPGGTDLAALLAPRPVVAIAWLVLASGVAGMSIYLRLIRDWGPTRAGMYAFVAPLIASGLGAAVLGERLGATELAGGAIMLAAAALVLPTPRSGAREKD